jgi:hypothetical protein
MSATNLVNMVVEKNRVRRVTSVDGTDSMAFIETNRGGK